VGCNQIASGIGNADHGIMCAATVDRVADCMICRVVPQPTERQHIGNQINAAMIQLIDPLEHRVSLIVIVVMMVVAVINSVSVTPVV